MVDDISDKVSDDVKHFLRVFSESEEMQKIKRDLDSYNNQPSDVFFNNNKKEDYNPIYIRDLGYRYILDGDKVVIYSFNPPILRYVREYNVSDFFKKYNKRK